MNRIETFDLLKRNAMKLRRSIPGDPTPEMQAIQLWEDARYRMTREYLLRKQRAAAEVAEDDDEDFNIVITTKEKHK